MMRSIFVLSLVGIVSLIGAAGQAKAETLPTAIPNLLMWLKADTGLEDSSGGAVAPGGNVAVWRDQSGNATPWDAEANVDVRIAPKLATNADMNGQAVVRWATDPDFEPNGILNSGFNVPNGMLADGQEATYVVVFHAPNESLGKRIINFQGGGLNFRNYSKGSPEFGDPSVMGPFTAPVAYAGSIPVNTAPRYTVLRNRLNNVEHFVSGQLDTLTLSYNYGGGGSDGDWALPVANALSIGVWPARGFSFAGDMAEVMIFGGAVSDEDLAGLGKYIRGKYAILLIPEPASLMLLAMGGLSLMLAPRRRRR